MTRINVFRTNSAHTLPAKAESIAWGRTETQNKASVLVFAAALIVCSLTAGCSRENPKTGAPSATPQVAQTLAPTSIPVAPPATTAVVEAKPVHRKAVHGPMATVTYTNKDSGLSFQYPRKYVLNTGDKADQVVSSTFVPMNFPQKGGMTLAVVEIPDGMYPKSDLVSAMFDVSVNRSVTAEQCREFLTLQDNLPKSDSTVARTLSQSEKLTSPKPSTATSGSMHADTNATSVVQNDASKLTAGESVADAEKSKLMLGDMELSSSETLSGSESKKEDAKYYHAFENGACYEFALKVATTGSETDEGGKPVDHGEIFKHLEKILATVKISPVKSDSVEVEKQTAAVPTSVSPSPVAQ